jgi:hypothetical protein
LQRQKTDAAPKAKNWSGDPKCGSDFCTAWPTEQEAKDDRDKCSIDPFSFHFCWPIIRQGISKKVSSRVVPIWDAWAYGGDSSIRSLTKDFGADFASSPTTSKTTAFLVDELTKKLTSSLPTIPATGFVKFDIPTLIPSAVKAIDTPKDAHEMNFNLPGDIPGNLAGGLGKDQAANPVGAKPSPQNDARIAKGDVLVTRSGGHLMVLTNLSYTVKDTVDLCPGDCGAKMEMRATIPMSRWEATGISGDVPYTVDFSALVFPFFIPIPGAVTSPPAPATTAPPTSTTPDER